MNWVWCIAIVPLAFSQVALASSISFEGSGTLSITVFNQNRDIVHTLGFPYEMRVREGKWEIVYWWDKTEDHEKYRLTSFDGTNTYSYLWDERYFSENSSNSVPGIINSGPLPLDDEYTFIIWFAFCSADYLAENLSGKSIIPPPWAAPRRSLHAAMVEADLSLLSSGLPDTGEFFLTSEAKKSAASMGWLAEADFEEARAEIKKFPDGFLVGTHRVNDSTIIEGKEIPTEIEMEKYWPKTGNTEGSWLNMTYHLSVNDIHVGVNDPLISPPAIPDGYRLTIWDRRLRDDELDIASTSYQVSDGIWPTGDPSQEALAAFETARRIQTGEPPTGDQGGVKIGILIVILALAGLPIMVLLLSRR